MTTQIQTNDISNNAVSSTKLSSNLAELFSYRRPNLLWNSATQVSVEVNTGTANTTKVLFPDGEFRTVTEDIGSTNLYRLFDITATAEFTSGTADSGLRSSLSEATNTWYAIYAVKTTISGDNDKFVLVGDTIRPKHEQVATLNSNFGTNSWVYLGMIRNGDNASATGDILNFVQSGSVTLFKNVASGNSVNHPGIRMATSASATSITWTFSEGSGATQIPEHCTVTSVYGQSSASSGEVRLRNSAASYDHVFTSGPSSGMGIKAWVAFSTDNLLLSSASAAMDLFLDGYVDGALGVGPNPFVFQ